MPEGGLILSSTRRICTSAIMNLIYYLKDFHSVKEEGLTACEKFLNLRDHLVPSTADISHYIRSILTMNSFSFNSNCYLQIHGTAKGTQMAPSFANLFTRRLEREFLLTQIIISPFGPMANHYSEILSRALTVTTQPSNLLPPGQQNE